MVPWNQNTLYTDAHYLSASSSNVYRSKHTRSNLIFLAQSASIPVSVAFNGQASSLITDWSSWAAVFDQYRIVGLEIFIEPVSGTSLATSTLPSGKLYTVIDYDDSTVLATINAALAYDNCIATTSYQRQRRCFAPRIALAAYGSSAFSSYANEAAPWIDCSSGTVEHYGLKAITEAGTAGALIVWMLTCRAEVEFRAAR
jgi:hypothetical protein